MIKDMIHVRGTDVATMTTLLTRLKADKGETFVGAKRARRSLMQSVRGYIKYHEKRVVKAAIDMQKVTQLQDCMS